MKQLLHRGCENFESGKIMKSIITSLSFLSFLILLVGCKRSASPTGTGGSFHSAVIEHDQAIEEGYKSIDHADSIRKKYQSVSMIQNFRHFSLPQKWKTIFYVNGRYEMVLEIPVSYNEKPSRLSPSLSESELHISEISEIRIIDGGRHHIRYRGEQRRLDSNEIEALAKSDWNFEAIGLSPAGSPIPNLEGYIRSWVPKYPAQKEALDPRGTAP